MDSRNPVAILRDLELKGHQGTQVVLPEAQPVTGLSGLAFCIGGERLFIPLDELKEVYSYARHPKPTLVPNAKSWLVGMSSLRGQLLAVVDLAQFLELGRANGRRIGRVLVAKHPRAAAGLLVDEVTGLRHFTSLQKAHKGPAFKGRVANFLNEVYHQDGHYWGSLSVYKLVQHPEFSSAIE
ncbi:MAG: chemotaxis protein CheW [Gammaproteobacteria bacterium]|nr:chemotaxis protein CheW [Gammaproteobacteria bacterium]